MAEQRRVESKPVSTTVEAHLRQVLPAEYLVVGQPQVRGVPLDLVVVGPQGLFVLHPLEWSGQVTPGKGHRWVERAADGQVRRHTSPAAAAERARQALLEFLHDEFPRLKVDIHQFAVLFHPDATLVLRGVSRPPCVTLNALGPEIQSVPTSVRALRSADIRQELALALEERQLTRSARVVQPFIFGSGGWFGRGYQARTLKQVIRHLDRYPQDGVYHLRNGTLEQWFRDQGALHLARLAGQTVQNNLRDARAALEAFMLGSGMVQRPRLLARPRRVKLGYVLEGQTAQAALELRKGRGRGYIYGRVEASDPWVQVVPTEIEGKLQGSVTVDTSMLTIKREPWEGGVRVYSSASDEPTEVPIEVHVVPALPGVARVVLRPLLGLLIGAVLGGAIGLLLGATAIDPPLGVRGITDPPLPRQAAWALVCGALWGVVGMLRGSTWNPVLPTRTCVARWLVRVLLWGITLTALAFLSPYLARWLFPSASAAVSADLEQTIKLIAVTLAVVPATWGELLDAAAVKAGQRKRRNLRGLLRGIAASLVIAALLVLLRLGEPLWERWQGASRLGTARVWIEQRWEQLGAWVDDLWGEAYLRQNDRRAPTRAPATPTPEATPGAQDVVQ